jgi:hypothetical protein
MIKTAKPPWTCPKCGQQFVNTNQWHSCSRATVDQWKARMSPRALAIFNRFEQLVAANGEYSIAPAKTRIAFLAKVRFGGIRWVRGDTVCLGFSLPQPLRSKRLSRVVESAPGWFSHDLIVTDPDQMDEEFQEWLRQSYHLMGMQRRLRAPRTPRSTGRVTPQ